MGKDIYLHNYKAPCGVMVLGSYGDELCLCDWGHGLPRSVVANRLRKSLKTDFKYAGTTVIMEAERQLEEYFTLKRLEFDIPILLCGTDFQKEVWNALRNVRYGTVLSYKEFASLSGHPTSVRPIAQALKVNALSIILPCHRIIGNNGALVGYAGGLPAKEHLLNLEYIATHKQI